MAAKFRSLTRGYIKGTRNRVCSLDNLLDERKPATAAINKFPSDDHLHFTGENDSDAFPRKRAWTEPTDMCNEDKKLTEDWMRDWQVGLKSHLEVLIKLRIHLEPREGKALHNIQLKCRFISGNFQWRI